MNNIYTEIDSLVKEHLDEEFEISEMLDLRVVKLGIVNGKLTDDSDILVAEKYKWKELFEGLRTDFSVVGYLSDGELILAQGWDGNGKPWSTKQLIKLVDLYNLNPYQIRVKRVAVHENVLRLHLVKDALKDTDEAIVKKALIKELTDMCFGVSRVTGGVRKGLIFKSPNFAFKVYSEDYLKSLN